MELLSAVVVVGILLTVSLPGINDAVGNNATRMEANRLLTNIQFVRSEAVKRGENIYMCIADAEACDPGNLATCRCKTGVPAKRYDLGYLVFVDSDGDQDFDNGSEELLVIGQPSADQIEMISNNLIQFGIGLGAGGEFSEDSGQGEIGICFNGESTNAIPGRRVVVKITGRVDLEKLAAGADCRPGPG